MRTPEYYVWCRNRFPDPVWSPIGRYSLHKLEAHFCTSASFRAVCFPSLGEPGTSPIKSNARSTSALLMNHCHTFPGRKYSLPRKVMPTSMPVSLSEINLKRLFGLGSRNGVFENIHRRNNPVLHRDLPIATIPHVQHFPQVLPDKDRSSADMCLPCRMDDRKPPAKPGVWRITSSSRLRCVFCEWRRVKENPVRYAGHHRVA